MVDVVAPIFNFIALALILWVVSRKAVIAFFVSRSETIEKAISDAKMEAEKAEKALSEWREKQAGAKAQAGGIRESMEERLRAYRLRVVEHARSEVDRIMRETELVGRSELERSRQQLEHEIVSRSVAVAGEEIKQKLSPEVRERLVSEYVEILEP